ncbi:DUF4249 family protein [Crocinitomix catalasitica]|uniref:DUF4249 family protein n=1 Tax=Crocinitomix catalasitica TaxID=184607 RepID=UPI00048565B0|nr:DUF4249 family protein [Crocinitomix catalasitica]
MLRIIFNLFIAIIVLQSCEKELPFNEDQEKYRLVVQSEITTKDTNYCIISSSLSVLDGNFNEPYVNDATITLFENDVEIGNFEYLNSIYKPGTYYITGLVVKARRTYKIIVSHPKYETVEGSFIMPSILNPVDINLLKTGERYVANMSFTDNSDEANFYGLGAYSIVKNIFIDPLTADTTILTSLNKNLFCSNESFFLNTINSDGNYCDPELLFNDKNKDGRRIDIQLKSNLNESFSDTLFINFKSFSEDMMKYKLSVLKYELTKGNYFAEPVLVHSNIKNGLGIFAGYANYNIAIPVPE